MYSFNRYFYPKRLFVFVCYILSSWNISKCVYNRTQQTEFPQAHRGRPTVQRQLTLQTSCPCNQVPWRLIPTWKVCMSAPYSGFMPPFPLHLLHSFLYFLSCIFPTTGSNSFWSHTFLVLGDLFRPVSGSGFMAFTTLSSWEECDLQHEIPSYFMWQSLCIDL